MSITDIRTKIAGILKESADRIEATIKQAIPDEYNTRIAGYDYSGSFALALIEVLNSVGIAAFPRALTSGEGEYDYGDDGDPWETATSIEDIHNARRIDDKADFEVTPDGGVTAWLVGVPGMENSDDGYGIEGLFTDYDDICRSYSKHDDAAGMQDYTIAQMKEWFVHGHATYNPEWHKKFKSLLAPAFAQWRQSAPPG